MRLLLISNSTNFGENYLAWASTQIELFCLQNHINKDSRIVFVPFAGVNIGGMVYPQSYDAYESKVRNVFRTKFGLENFTSVHHFDDKVKAVNEADCIVVGGGNTFHLVAEMHRYGLMEAIRNRALAGVPYMGWSAGSNVACPTLCTTNDMPIVQPASFNCLNLVPFQINPHYLDPHPDAPRPHQRVSCRESECDRGRPARGFGALGKRWQDDAERRQEDGHYALRQGSRRD